jgi:hypothetical protein
MNNFETNRRHPRKELHTSIVMEVWNSAEGARNLHMEVSGTDISSGGIGIATGQPLLLGDIVKLDYPLNGNAILLPIYSEVVWCTVDNGVCRAGLRFLS